MLRSSRTALIYPVEEMTSCRKITPNIAGNTGSKVNISAMSTTNTNSFYKTHNYALKNFHPLLRNGSFFAIVLNLS